MMNLLTPRQDLGFNTQDLKPGMIVKFSILTRDKIDHMCARIENYGIIDEINCDKLCIITNTTSASMIFSDGKMAPIDEKRFRNAFIPFNGDCSDVYVVKDVTPYSIEIIFGIEDIKMMSLELSFLDMDRYCEDPMTNRKSYYWR